MKKHKRQPDAAAGIFAVTFGALCLVLVIFATAPLGRKVCGAASGLYLLAWGSGQLRAARKSKNQESDDAKEKGT
jgi:threonine/homoserine/homoserine lactone efflux protein